MPGRKPFLPRGKSMTKQSFGDQSDINTIVAKFIATGTLDWFNSLQPRFGDFTGVEDYHSCLNRVVEAQTAFDSLPARIRAYFQNDPALLVEAAHDPSRREELRELGFVPLGEPGPRGTEAPDEPEPSLDDQAEEPEADQVVTPAKKPPAGAKKHVPSLDR